MALSYDTADAIEQIRSLHARGIDVTDTQDLVDLCCATGDYGDVLDYIHDYTCYEQRHQRHTQLLSRAGLLA